MNLTADPAGMVRTASTSRRRRGSGSPQALVGTGLGYQPLDHKWPRERDGLETLSWLMDLLGMELAGFASLHQFDGVVECRGPIEPTVNRLADKGP